MSATGKDDELNNDNVDDNINGNQGPDAGEKRPEDATGGAYDKVIDSQNQTISALLGQIESLNSQITKLVRANGTESTETPDDASNDASSESGELGEDYVYLKDLGTQIGKRDK